MQIYERNEYDWNHVCAPAGNLAGINPQTLSEELDAHGIPWYTTGWPYSSGLLAYCDDELWKRLCKKAKSKV